jgi:hypothetical protein
VCAVCGESLPPDHFYCREHAATVDDRLHEIGRLLPQVTADLGELGRLLGEIAPETWDYLAEQEPDDPTWPPDATVVLRPDADGIDVTVDDDPGYVQLRLSSPLDELLPALAQALSTRDWARLTGAAAQAEGTNATH